MFVIDSINLKNRNYFKISDMMGLIYLSFLINFSFKYFKILIDKYLIFYLEKIISYQGDKK
jgi:hypothetical protein